MSEFEWIDVTEDCFVESSEGALGGYLFLLSILHIFIKQQLMITNKKDTRIRTVREKYYKHWL